MQFPVVALLVAFAASAVPTAVHFNRQACDVASCASSLGSTAANCVSAAVQEGLDPISDGKCLFSGLNSAINAPSSCNGCTTSIGSVVKSAFGSVENDIKSIF